jgi:hypothetical protein
MMRTLLLAMLALAGCVAPNAASGGQAPTAQRPADDPALSYGGLNENIRVGNLIVRPLAVAEDSRCPVNVACVWAGRVVLSATVSGMAGEQVISSIEPLALPDGGSLALESIWPAPVHGARNAEPYRFGFRRRP